LVVTRRVMNVSTIAFSKFLRMTKEEVAFALDTSPEYIYPDLAATLHASLSTFAQTDTPRPCCRVCREDVAGSLAHQLSMATI